jgi:hypothetical protein
MKMKRFFEFEKEMKLKKNEKINKINNKMGSNMMILFVVWMVYLTTCWNN